MEIMQETALNLCDTTTDYHEWMKSGHDWSSEIKRVYLGSYFCFQHFMHRKEDIFHKEFQLCREKHLPVTLVLPIITEQKFESMKQLVEQILIKEDGVIDEICANDYGTLSYLAGSTKLPLHMGRLLFKNYRDPRYEDYYNSTVKPNLFSKYSRKIMEEFRIRGIEFDPAVSHLDLSEAFSDLIYSIHRPYCYVTTGQICEFCSIHQPMDQKFRPGMECHEECRTNHMEYNIEEGRNMQRRGKAVFFRNDSIRITGVPKIREIWDMDEILRAGRQIGGDNYEYSRSAQ